MKGIYTITVSNDLLKYEFTLRRNLTIVRGESGTGKTTLVGMIQEYFSAGQKSGIQLRCDRECRVLAGRDWLLLLQATKESIVFIDEDNDFIRTHEFARAIEGTDNYYVIFTREWLPSLPYSVDEIYGIRSSGKYGGLQPVYHEFFHIYSPFDFAKVFQPEEIIVEDTNSGFEFFHSLSDGKPYQVISAEGKAKIFSLLESVEQKKTLIIADGAAFGPEMERVSRFISSNANIVLFLPESFEWMVLSSGVIRQGNLQQILSRPEDHIESAEYFSWERYFTHLLIELTNGTYLQYSKRRLNPAYQSERIRKQILQLMHNIQL